MPKSARYILTGQIIFVVGIACCTALIPHFLFSKDEGGTSNYGTYLRTVVSFSISFIGVGTSLIMAGLVLPKDTISRSSLQYLLYIVGTLTLVTTITTYTYRLSPALHSLHITASQILFYVEVPAAIWLWFSPKRTILNHMMFTVYALGLILAVLTLFGLLHVLFIAEVLSTLGLGFLFFHTTRNLTENT